MGFKFHVAAMMYFQEKQTLPFTILPPFSIKGKNFCKFQNIAKPCHEKQILV